MHSLLRRLNRSHIIGRNRSLKRKPIIKLRRSHIIRSIRRHGVITDRRAMASRHRLLPTSGENIVSGMRIAIIGNLTIHAITRIDLPYRKGRQIFLCVYLVAVIC